MLDTEGKEKRREENTKLKKKSLECRLKLTLSKFPHGTSNNVVTIKWCFSKCHISGFRMLIRPFFWRFQGVLLESYEKKTKKVKTQTFVLGFYFHGDARRQSGLTGAMCETQGRVKRGRGCEPSSGRPARPEKCTETHLLPRHCAGTLNPAGGVGGLCRRMKGPGRTPADYALHTRV